MSLSQAAATQTDPRPLGGPRTPEGKARSRMNALKTGLTGHTVLLPTDDSALYQQHVQSFADEWQPVGAREMALVQALADHQWRLTRIAGLEMAIYAQGRELFADRFSHYPDDMQAQLIQLQTHLLYEKQLRNLQLQEQRLRRHREKDTAELRSLQSNRLGIDESQVGKAPMIPTKINVHICDKQGNLRYTREIDWSNLPAKPPSEFEFSKRPIDAELDSVERSLHEHKLPDAA